MRKALLGLLFVLAAFGCCGETFRGKVIAVSDGDTVQVLRVDGTKRTVRVRLDGIDAPESNQPYGKRAKQYLSAMAFGKTVRLDVKDRDKYGRTVAVVWVPSRVAKGPVAYRNANLAMVAAGLAWWYRQYVPRNRELEKAETAARKSHVGLWGDKKPVPPWEWRHGGAVRHAIETGRAKAYGGSK